MGRGCKQQRRILIIEDDVDTAEILRELLQSSGYDVSLAHDEAGALEQAMSFLPTVVLLDTHLEEGDGLRVREQLASVAQHPLRVIAITGNLRLEEEHLKALGFEALLYKPLDIPQMLEMLGALCATNCPH